MTSPSLMPETGHSKPVHWDNQEGWDGEWEGASGQEDTCIPMADSYQCMAKTTAAAAAKSLQSCPTLCDPRDDSPPGSPVPGILQARTLE